MPKEDMTEQDKQLDNTEQPLAEKAPSGMVSSPANCYELFVIDPPWDKRKGGLRNVRPLQGKRLDYQTMSTQEIFALLDAEIFSMSSDNHIVFMWTIESYLTECDTEMLRRGYKRHIRMIWDKTNGIAPAFTIRYCHEYLIWYYKPKMIPIAKPIRGKLKSIFSEPAREHSRKPDVAYNMITALYPDLNKVDVFSREKRQGYAQWGNECDAFSA